MQTAWLLVVVIALGSSAVAAKKKADPKPPAPTVSINLDATEAARKIFHAKLSIPATPGDLVLYYPKWIPGEHGPTGPIQDLAGLKFSANGQELKWRRDLLDGWALHVEVPARATQVEASLDFLSPAGGEGIYTAGASATNKLTIIAWNTMLLYPAGWTSDELKYQAILRLPDGWKSGTALPVESQAGGEIKYKTVSLTTLVDSPIVAAEFLRVVPLDENPHQQMDIAADSAAALDIPTEVLDRYKVLTDQAYKLFGARHFNSYHFLYSLSDHVAHFGLEHHESNDSREGERYMIDPDLRMLAAGLLTHEYVHTWNGKYRRPQDLATSNYDKPMQTDLLWVYEGLTSYLGDILSGRSGIRTPQQFNDTLAEIAASLDNLPGRTWRNLQDTADGVPAMQGAPGQWHSWRRGLDYYEEDVLNWLWADTIIRQQTNGQKTLDDFCHLFHGGQSGPPEVKTYNFDDIVTALNQVAPYDWRGFWTQRLTNHGPGAPLTGIENSGWKLIYDDNRSDLVKAREGAGELVDASFSIGLIVKKDGAISDTIEGMPAAKAGIGPGMKLIGVNGRIFTDDALRDALKATKNSRQNLEFLVENTGYYKTFKVDYQGGERYPHLVRDESKPDMLGEIIKAR
jgi:predicted metalloprotease with PDZ domain